MAQVSGFFIEKQLGDVERSVLDGSSGKMSAQLKYLGTLFLFHCTQCITFVAYSSILIFPWFQWPGSIITDVL